MFTDGEAIAAYKAIYKNKYVKFSLPIANVIGIKETIIIKIVEDWCEKNEASKDKQYYRKGKYWTRLSYPEISERYPCLGTDKAIQKLILKLESSSILISDNFNKLKSDRTKWYRVNDAAIGRIFLETTENKKKAHYNSGSDPEDSGSDPEDSGSDPEDSGSDPEDSGSDLADYSGSDHLYTRSMRSKKRDQVQPETLEEADRSLSFFSESEPEAKQPLEPTENSPLLAEVEIKAEDKPTPNFQGQEKNHGVSVESENKAPQPPAYYNPSPEKNGKSNIKFPELGDIDSAPYCQELCFLKFELPDELALGTKQIIQSKRKVFGRQLLCLMNDQGIDPIANLSKFLKFYFDKNLANNSNYKGKEYDSLVQSQTAQAIANKIKDSDHAVLVQTIAEFKKKITKAAQPAPQINFSEPIPEGDRYTLPKIDNLFEEQKKRIKQQQAKNKPKMTSLSKNEVSITLESVTASNANLSPNPETFESEYDF